MKKLCKTFSTHSVSVCGEKGAGKDILFANVVARRKKPYISNTDYKCDCSYIKLRFDKLRIGNTYRDFLDNTCKEYIYPYPDGTDVYIADCGIYFPAQYCNELNRDYKDVPVFLALSRQLGDCRVHTNAQALSRVWDKIREQSTRYILCEWCKVVKIPFIRKQFVIQRITEYERYQSCVDRAIPFRVPCPLFDNKGRLQWKLQKAQYEQQNGKIKRRLLVYMNKSAYDTRIFKEILENGKEETKKQAV